MNIRVLVTLVLLIGYALPSLGAEREDAWPQWRGPERNGKAPATNLLKDWETQKPKLLWMAEGLGQGYASVSIADDTLYTTGNFDDGQAVIAFDLNDKKVAWKETLTPQVPKHGYTGSRCTPTIDGDDLYVLMSEGTVARLHRKTGKVIWKKNLQEQFGAVLPTWGFAESPLVDGNRVVCGAGSNEALLVCLNKKNGEVVWTTPRGDTDLGPRGKDEAGYSSTLISNGGGVKQYVKLIGRGVIGVDAQSGKLLWHYNPVANDVASIPDPVIAGDYIFASSGYQTGAALLHLKKSGRSVKAEEVYFLEARTFQNHHGGMVLVDGHIYAGTKHNNGFPICIELNSGDVKWGGDFRGVGDGSAAVLYADGHLIFRYQSGELALIEATPEEYRLKGSFMPEYQEKESWSHPVIVDGRLYLREQDKLMCYDIRAK